MKRRPIYLYVTPFFPTPGRHYGSYGYDFVASLSRLSDYDVHVFVPGAGPDYVFNGVTVHRFKTRELPSSILPLLFAGWNARSFLTAVRRAGVDLSEVAVCHGNTAAFSIYPLTIKRKNGACKTVLHHHDLASCGMFLGCLKYVWLHKVANWWMLRRRLDAIDLHVFISEASRRSFWAFPETNWSVHFDYVRLGRGIRWMRPAVVRDSIVLHNGVDRKLFACKRVSHEGFVIGCAGIYWPIKDHRTLFEAVAILKGSIPGLKLRLMGEPADVPYGRAVRSWVDELGLGGIVTFEPWVSHVDLPRYYQAIDLYVMPCYFEGFGCVYTESWSCGTPFIACEGQGIEDVILPEERKDWLCRSRDPKDLAGKILSFYRLRKEQHLREDVSFDGVMPTFIQKVAAK